ncbi:MAG: PadR family transcriptional regulator [Atribacterota bacterium]
MMKKKRRVSNGCPGFKIERFFRPCLLLLLAHEPSHGYELLEEIRKTWFQNEMCDGGLVYRSLRRMEEEGLVRSEWTMGSSGPAKRVYYITEKGHAALRSWVVHIQSQLKRFEAFLRKYEELLSEKRGKTP